MFRTSGYTVLSNLIRVKQAVVLTVVVGAFALMPLVPAQAAGTAKLYISPAKTSVVTGQNVALSIRIDVGSKEATAIEVNGVYDQSKLQFIGIDGAGSAFDFAVDSNGGNGSFRVTRVAFSDDVSGDALVAKITFKTLSAGSSEVKLSDNSEISDPEGKLFSLQLSAASIASNTATSGSGGSGGSSGGNSGGGTSTNNRGGPTSQPTSSSGLSISVRPNFVGYTIASFDVTTSKNAKVSLSYGPAADDLEFTTKQTKSSTKHNVTTDSRTVIPGRTYFYQITATTSNGGVSKSDVFSFETLGIPLSIQVLNKDGNPVKGVTVNLKNVDVPSAKTNGNGYAFFDKAPGGDLTVVVSPGFWQKTEHILSVTDFDLVTKALDGPSKFSQTANTVSASLKLDYNPVVFSTWFVLKIIGIILGALAALVVLIRLFNILRWRMAHARNIEKQQAPNIVGPQTGGPPPISQNISELPPTPQPPATQSSAPGQVIRPETNKTDNQQ